MDLYLKKMPGGVLIPLTEEDKEELAKYKTGEIVKAKMTRPRNLGFHRKWFALVKYAFGHWTPPEFRSDDPMLDGKTPRPSFKHFRKNIVKLTGRFERWINIDGTWDEEAESIAFSNMNQEEFEKVFSDTINVILEHVEEMGFYSPEELDRVVAEILAFDG